jgi:hypothetical protein
MEILRFTSISSYAERRHGIVDLSLSPESYQQQQDVVTPRHYYITKFPESTVGQMVAASNIGLAFTALKRFH